MEAGIEHLGRATAESVDILIIVVEAGRRSFQTAAQIEKLAADIGIKNIAYVASKVDGEPDRTFISAALPESRLLGTLSSNELIREADRLGLSPYDTGGEVLAELDYIKKNLARFIRSRTEEELEAEPA
jgi:CO dehydrogenase maturation factor